MKSLQVAFFASAVLFCMFAVFWFGTRIIEVVSPLFWQPRIEFVDLSHDFGNVEKDTLCVHRFGFRNTGNAELKIGKISLGCGACIEIVDYPRYGIAPEETGVVSLRLIATHLSGYVTKDVYVKTNDVRQPDVILTLSANVNRPNLDQPIDSIPVSDPNENDGE